MKTNQYQIGNAPIRNIILIPVPAVKKYKQKQLKKTKNDTVLNTLGFILVCV